MAVESVAGCAWNGWPDHRGMAGRMGVEYTIKIVVFLKMNYFLLTG
jgi:hypothetical protein